MKVLKIGAAWCSGCLVMKPRWGEIEKELPWLKTEFYDYDESPEAIRQYNINESLPVAIVLDDDGSELHRFEGEVAKDDIRKKLEILKNQ